MNTKIVNTLGAAIGTAVLLLTASNSQAQNLFVGSYGAESIVEIPTSGPQSTFATGLNYPDALAFNSAGDLFEADQMNGNVYEYKPNQPRITFASSLSSPSALAVNGLGDVFVNSGNSILEYGPGGGSSTPFAMGMNQPLALTFDSLGNLYVANGAGLGAGNGFITKITPGGSQSPYASGLSSPDGLAFDSLGNLYVSGGNGANTITKIAPNGGSSSPFASGLNAPIGLAFNNLGDLFVADGGVNSQNGDITEFAPGGTVLNTITSVSKPLSLAFQPVPEPSVAGLSGVGALVLFASRYLRRR